MKWHFMKVFRTSRMRKLKKMKEISVLLAPGK